ncbi:MAG: division/cell wall cluster transcriptional repressor MraZ [Clostridia bacterium]|nr:division/cell wall cluster transcriptional repressor MraZ [Clostridia bacterium]
MLTGEFRPTLDPKNRIFVPSKLREELGETFMIVRDTRVKCLKMYSLEGWAEFIRPIKEKRGEKSEMILRTLHSTAAQVTPDSQGRVLIPNKLIEFAGLEKTIVVIGCYDYAEIWSENGYDSMVASQDDDALRDAMEELGL